MVVLGARGPIRWHVLSFPYTPLSSAARSSSAREEKIVDNINKFPTLLRNKPTTARDWTDRMVTVTNGDKVEVIERYRIFSKIKDKSGNEGWIRNSNLR